MKNLRRVILANINMKRVQNAQVLKIFNKLHEFEIGGSELANTHEFIQHLDPNVEQLRFYNNSVGHFNLSSFLRFPNMTDLVLDNVSLSITEFSPLFKLENLKWLDISNNNLSGLNFSSGTFIEMVKFRARNCHISNASQIINSLGPELLTLDLSGNNLEGMNPAALLNELRFDNTNLTNFNLIEFPSDLRKLSIANNHLKPMDLFNIPK